MVHQDAHHSGMTLSLGKSERSRPTLVFGRWVSAAAQEDLNRLDATCAGSDHQGRPALSVGWHNVRVGSSSQEISYDGSEPFRCGKHRRGTAELVLCSRSSARLKPCSDNAF